MLDLHVLLHHKNAEWNTQCRSTIAAAVGQAPYPVAVHYLQGEDGHIGRGRARGYALGQHPYVTYVDHDDYLLPDALEALWPALQEQPDAIFPRELNVLKSGFVRANNHQRHHLCLYKREFIIDHTQYVACGDLAQIYAMDGKNVVDLPHRGYVHRNYDSPGRDLRLANPEEYQRVIHGR